MSGPRAVVWSPRGGSGAHARLLESLRRQGAEPLEVTSDLWAMAHACLCGAAGEGALLVLCEPARLREPEHVVLALRKYWPGVVCWAYEPGSSQLLRKVTDQDLIDWGAPGEQKQEPKVETPRRIIGQPSLRLVEGGEPRPIGPSLPITAFDGAVQSADVLSAEELAMLLGRNGSHGAGGGGGGAPGGRGMDGKSAKGDLR
ncbi:MAG: hypothetical protein QM783_18000 [Phycisphaerales bacterium]